MFAPKVAKKSTTAVESPASKLVPDRSTLARHTPGHAPLERALERHHPPTSHRMTVPAASWDLSQIPSFSAERPKQRHPSSWLAVPELPAALRAKLAVGRVDDPLEQEADRVADQVMRMPAPDISHGPVAERISRNCAACEKDELHKMPAEPQREPMTAEDEDEDETPTQPLEAIRRSAAASGQPGPASGGERAIEELRQGGEALSPSARQQFESRFGYDLGNVRIHTGSRADLATHAVRARAYTLGNNIVFGAGEYNPASERGQRLLAHELTHVVQQGHARPVEIAGDGPAVHAGTCGSARAPLGALAKAGGSDTIRREDKLPEPKKGGPKAQDTVGETFATPVKAALADIEANWAGIRDPAGSFGELKDWVAKGDTILGLIKQHAEEAMKASASGDSSLFFYREVVEADRLMYNFVAWHVVVHMNLLGMKSDLDRLAAALDADKRSFTGRAEAEKHLALLRDLTRAFLTDAATWLPLVKTLPANFTRGDGSTVTGDRHDRVAPGHLGAELFVKRTEENIQLQTAIQSLNAEINLFLDRAFEEGLVQAVESVAEFYSVRGRSKGGGAKGQSKGKSGGKKEEKQKKGGKGKYGCIDVRCNVHSDQQADPPNPNCPERVIGNTPFVHPSFDMACKAAQRDANSKVPRGCIKRHCNCKTKCYKK